MYGEKVNEIEERLIENGYEIENKEKEYDIIEMLYCDSGCNNGNGL